MHSGLFEDLRQRVEGKKVLILGVGNRLRGDDAVGSLIIDRLQGHVKVPLIDAGDVPENFLGPIEETGAEIVLVIDAANFGGQPGEFSLLGLEQLRKINMFTHNPSLALMFQVISPEHGLKVLLVGIQPETTETGHGVSEAVEKSMAALETMIVELFG